MTTRICLSNGRGKCLLIDDDHALAFRRSTWSIDSVGYPAARVNKRLIRAHTLVMGPGEGVIDHINRDRLDNRRANLRRVTRVEQAQNTSRRARGAGVYPTRGGKWFARISVNYRPVHLGTFTTKEQARAARLAAEKEHYVLAS